MLPTFDDFLPPEQQLSNNGQLRAQKKSSAQVTAIPAQDQPLLLDKQIHLEWLKNSILQ